MLGCHGVNNGHPGGAGPEEEREMKWDSPCWFALLAAAVVVCLAGCAGSGRAPNSDASDDSPEPGVGIPGVPSATSSTSLDPGGTWNGLDGSSVDACDGVGTIGSVVAVDGPIITVLQEAFEVTPASGVGLDSPRYVPPIGHVGNHLKVVTGPATQVVVAGEPGAPGLLAPGTVVLVGGKPEGDVLRARVVCDFATIVPPERVSRSAERSHSTRTGPATDINVAARVNPVANASALWCTGQDMGFVQPNVREFQGCYGGPQFETPELPVHKTWGVPLVAEVGIRAIKVELGAGASFDFPWEFRASAATPAIGSDHLVYHVPGDVLVRATPLAARDGYETFWSTVGVQLWVNWWAWVLGDDFDLGWDSLSPFSQTNHSTGAAPVPGESLMIETDTCATLSLGLKGMSLIDILWCSDMKLVGEPHDAWLLSGLPWNQLRARAVGTTGELAASTARFDDTDEQLQVTPDDLSVDVVFDQFWYVPTMKAGWSVELDAIFGVFDVWESGTVWGLGVPWACITTPFPMWDPYPTFMSEADGYPQPTEVTIELPVDPAPTRLTIISSNTVPEGEPIRALLQEEYWADEDPAEAAIEGEEVVFTAGTEVHTATTNAQGIAGVVLDIGAYQQIHAKYAGSDYYLTSEDTQERVFVYRPTNFVVWGGYGMDVGQRCLFWGSQWWRQIYDTVPGKVHGIAAFKGWAEQVNAEWWACPGASGNPPPAVPSYIGAIVTTDVNKQGRRILGNVDGRVVLEVEDPSAYEPVPSHSNWGEMKAEIVSTDQAAVASFAGAAAHGVACSR